MALLMILLFAPACSGSRTGSGSEVEDAPRLVMALDDQAVGLDQPTPGSLGVPVGLFLTKRDAVSLLPWSEAAVSRQIRPAVAKANEILSQCDIHLEPEVAQVVALPPRLLDIQGNEKGSWGGHPPPGVRDPELFAYRQDERLTREAREVFGYGKTHTSQNTISVFTVEHIEYYVGDERTAAAGLSHPPNSYHHSDDYPLRNSVLLVAEYPKDGRLPYALSGRTLAHEIGHMLLNSGGHSENASNLMGQGLTLTEEQCALMRHNRDSIYGRSTVPDPGSSRQPIMDNKAGSTGP